jgi:osmotically-inducible protein OsmY
MNEKRHRPDDHIREDVTEALAGYTPLRLSLPFIRVTAVGGVVTLHGNVKNASHKSIAEERAASVQGVTTVQNLLSDDGELLNRIMAAFDRHAATRVAHGPIETFLGVVTLRGPAPSQAFATRAPELALRVAGVRLVMNQLQGDVGPAEPWVEAWLGRQAVVGGKDAGRVTEVLVDPLSWRVGGVMLSKGKLPKVWTLVPPSACTQSDSRHLYLDLTEQEFGELPYGVHDKPAGDADSPLVLHRGTGFQAHGKGRLGSIAGVRFNPETGEISHIIMRSGWFHPVNSWLPITAISVGAEGDVLTSLSRDTAHSIAAAGEPWPVSDIIRRAEGRLLFQRWRAVPAGIISIRCMDRRLQLEAILRNELDSLAVEELLRGLPGVVVIETSIAVQHPAQAPKSSQPEKPEPASAAIQHAA